jgi:hypothetical protein
LNRTFDDRGRFWMVDTSLPGSGAPRFMAPL